MYANLEIRIQKCEELAGYPVDLTVNSNRLPLGGYLAPDILFWQPCLASTTEGKQLFDLLLAQSSLRQNWVEIATSHP